MSTGHGGGQGGGHRGGRPATNPVKIVWIKIVPVTNTTTGTTTKKVFFQGYEGPDNAPTAIKKGYFDLTDAASIDDVRKLTKSAQSAYRLTYDDSSADYIKHEYTDRFQFPGEMWAFPAQTNAPSIPQPSIDDSNKHRFSTTFSEPA